METIQMDVVVIGSGMGGMCTAALLAHAGYKTLVIEGLNSLGGRFSSIEYQGIKIATGGHMVNHGKDDPICQTLDEVRAPEVEFKEFKVPVKYRIKGKDILLEAKGGLQNLVDFAANNQEESRRVMQALYKTIRWQEPPDTLSMKDWLFQLTENQRIHNIFHAQATSFSGVNLQDFPSGEFIRFLRAYARHRGALVPKNTGKTIIEAFKSATERDGGQIHTTTWAIRIPVEKGKVKGVIAQNKGREIFIEAKTVISNMGPRKTLALAGDQHFEGWYVKQVSERVRPTVAMNYIIVSKKPLVDSLLFTTEARRAESWCPTTLFWPEEAHAGMHVMESVAVPPSGGVYDPKKEYQAFMEDLKEELPHFEECGGRILLTRRFCGEWPYNRCIQGLDLPQKTTVEYLYNVGDGVKPSGWVGASGAAMSGRLVAQDIKKGFL